MSVFGGIVAVFRDMFSTGLTLMSAVSFRVSLDMFRGKIASSSSSL